MASRISSASALLSALSRGTSLLTKPAAHATTLRSAVPSGASHLRPLAQRISTPRTTTIRLAHTIPRPPQQPSPSPSPSPSRPSSLPPSLSTSEPYASPDHTPDSSTSSSTSTSTTSATPPPAAQPTYELTFTCVPCGTRSGHRLSKQGYHHGSVLITCPSCRNRHVISDHLGIFGDRKGLTVEDLMRERGRLVKRGTLGEDGDVEFWEDGSVTSRDERREAEDVRAHTPNPDAVADPEAAPGSSWTKSAQASAESK